MVGVSSATTGTAALPQPRSRIAFAAATRALSFSPLWQISTSVASAVSVCSRANSLISPFPFGRPPGLPLRPFSNLIIASCYLPVLRLQLSEIGHVLQRLLADRHP